MSTPPNEPQYPQGGPQPGFGQQSQFDQHPEYGQQPAQPYAAPQAYGQQGGKYGTAEYNPNQYTGMAERPKAFSTLLTLTLASLAVYVLNGIVGLLASSSVDYVAYYKSTGMSTEQAEQAAQMAGGVGPIGMIVGLIIGIALYLLVYSGLKKVKNWARILGIIFAILSVVTSVVGMFGTGVYGSWGTAILILAVITLVVDALWLVNAFKAPVVQYFKQNKVR